MKKANVIATVVATVILTSSFSKIYKDPIIGTYKVSSNDPSQIELTLNADNTFYFQDFSISEKKIKTQGNWIFKGKKVILKSNENQGKFHNVWSFENKCQIAKSHKGLSFLTLRRTIK
jgi:hypothetical protein